MKVFVAGATGYIGAAVVKALVVRGHTVVGGARSDEAARKLEARGLMSARVDLDDPASFAAAARGADATIQAASASDATSRDTEPKVAHAIVAELTGTGKPFVLTSGVWIYGAAGEGPTTEATPANPIPLTVWRLPVETEVLTAKGMRGIVIRPGIVHGDGGGLAQMLIEQGKRDGKIRIPGDGSNRWSVVHVDDLGDLYALAVEHPTASGIFNGTTDETITLGDVGRILGDKLSLPVAPWPLPEVRAALGLFGEAFALDQVVRSPRSHEILGWTPRRPSHAEDLSSSSYG